MNGQTSDNGLPFRIQDETRGEKGRQYLHQLKLALEQRLPQLSSGEQAPLLLLRQPRWPLREILFVLRGDRRDLPALDWALALAGASRASVTVLVVYPDIPAFYTRCPKIQLELPLLLQMENEIGALLRKILRRSKLEKIPCELSLQKACPDDQIRMQVSESNCDLLIISQEGRSRLWRWCFGEITAPLLGWIDRPVLII
jgi:nucleotide-binding universal stress UspA family protein